MDINPAVKAYTNLNITDEELIEAPKKSSYGSRSIITYT